MDRSFNKIFYDWMVLKNKHLEPEFFVCRRCLGKGSVFSDREWNNADKKYCYVCNGTGLITWLQNIFEESNGRENI